MNQTEKYELLLAAFANGTVEQASTEELKSYLVTISNQVVNNDSVKHREIIRGLTLNHLLLQRHMDKLDKQNAVTQWAVIVLTIVSAIASIAQVYAAFK